MAKNYSKEGKASLIFIWILIILLAIGTVYVYKSYTEKSSDFIESEALEEAFSTTMGKPAGKITMEELAGVEGIDYYALGDTSLAVYYLNGYSELTSDDDAAKYIVQATVSNDDFMKDIDLFTGINSFTIQNYSGTDFIFDMNTIPAETYKNLETFYTSNVTVDNNNLIATHKNLKTLGLSSAGLVNIPDISALENLESVDFSYNEITDISALSVLDNEKITSVVLSGNKIEDLSPIAHIDEDKITNEVPEEEGAEGTEETTEPTEETTEGTEEAATEEATETAEEAVEETTETAEDATAETTEETTEVTE